MVIQKTISINEAQNEYIKVNHIALSRMVQDMLNKEIENKKN